VAEILDSVADGMRTVDPRPVTLAGELTWDATGDLLSANFDYPGRSVMVAYVVVGWISDLATAPRYVSDELCDAVTERFVGEWVMLPKRQSERRQTRFLKRWDRKLDKVIAECQAQLAK